jgi:membrane associated rhomboid family serine protease
MNTLVREARGRIGAPLFFVVAMWVIEVVNLVTRNALLGFGIRPRTLEGLWGIVLAPLLHANVAHLLANSVPVLLLGWLVAVRGVRELYTVTGLVMLVGGAGVWLFGRPFSLHVGASGVVFGYLGFLLARGYFARSLSAILLSLVALGLYGGAIWGILPTASGISWEGHLFGFLAGIVTAWALSQPRGRRLS